MSGMSRKSKGINAERELIALFWETEKWAAHRIAGSGSSRFPSPDVLAGNGTRRLAIECKASKKPVKYLTKEEIQQLKIFAETFGAEPWIAVRFDKWFFLNLEDLKETKKSYVIPLDIAQRKGLIFEELVFDN